MKVKELKEQFVGKYNTIEVYTPTDKINCTSIKENHRLYKYSTNSDDKELDFYTIEERTNTLMIFTQ
jgi:hypothetical protein|nr:MAG TPA: hypothetical protein [Caudoviricetes sp.]